mmetsp:Transcript_15006/g.20884  ORF Transcript_15006/g.20884 Transcript_15006/m.20884 type:complete len:200 (-) Transcript_15006:377-976(-)
MSSRLPPLSLHPSARFHRGNVSLVIERDHGVRAFGFSDILNASSTRARATSFSSLPSSMHFVTSLVTFPSDMLSKTPSVAATMTSPSLTGTLYTSASSAALQYSSKSWFPSWYGMLNSYVCGLERAISLPFRSTRKPESPRFAAESSVEVLFRDSTVAVVVPGFFVVACAKHMAFTGVSALLASSSVIASFVTNMKCFE